MDRSGAARSANAALDFCEDMPEELPSDDLRAAHMGVYHWLTFVQDLLVQVGMAVR